MRWPWHKSVRIRAQALTSLQTESIRQAVVDSPYLGSTTLNMRFASTWGFSVAFRKEGLAKARKTFPHFIPYFDLVLEAGYNAFFLNPLVIFRGGSVDAHVDCSLRSYTLPLEPPCPGKVSVYYAQVPQGLEGGELLVSDERGRELARVKPSPNLLVQFDGDLLHRVTPFGGAGEAQLDGSRISLVCEHYRLDPALLIRVPEFHLETSRSFGEFFDKALETEGIGNEA